MKKGTGGDEKGKKKKHRGDEKGKYFVIGQTDSYLFPSKTAVHLIDYFLEVIPQVDRWHYHDHRKKGCT